MRVLILTHYYPPEIGAPQATMSRVARELQRRGVDVTVHTTFPHYPDGIIRAPYRNRPIHREVDPDQVRILRSAVYPAENRGVKRRLLNHTSFALSAIGTAAASGRQDVVIAQTPPLFTAAAGVAIARAKRAPLVLHVVDRWPESAVQLGALNEPRVIAMASALERWCYRNAAGIAVPTEPMAAAVGGVPGATDKVRCVGRAVDAERFDGTPPRPNGPLRVAYVGTVGLAHGLETLVDAARRAGPETVQVEIAGDGAERRDLERRLLADGPANVRFLGVVPPEKVPEVYARADAGTVLLRDRTIFEEALPTKLLEVMAAGRAAIVSARGEAARLVERAGAGIAVPPEDPGALADAFAQLQRSPDTVEQFGAGGRRHALDAFGTEALGERWLELLRAVARG